MSYPLFNFFSFPSVGGAAEGNHRQHNLEPGFHTEREEVHDNSAKEDGVSGVPGGYSTDGLITTTRKDSQNAGVQACQQ